MDYIILDIETTGLDIEYSSIIEVGAILVSNNQIKDEFHSFVQYTEDLPYIIKKLTGIQEDQLQDAPSLKTVLDKLKLFIKKYPVVAHNGYGFDFPILENAGIKITEKYDSMEFAFFVLPTHEFGHSIQALAERFGLGNTPHRALEDCKLELEVINKLREEYSKKPKEKMGALKFFSKQFNWWWTDFLPGSSNVVGSISSLVEKHEPYRKVDPSQDQLSIGTQKIDFSKEVEPFFIPKQGDIGPDDYSEDRPEQKKMAELISESFNDHKHLVIEAGTGTGKSKAYLVPSVAFALKNGIPIIIATHTKALQNQLFLKEIPHIKETMYPDLRVTMIKGKKNYVCLKKFEQFVDDVDSGMKQRSLYEFGQTGVKFTSRLAAVLLASWILETSRGDWDELPYWLTERIPKRVEQDICNWDELCTKDTCNYHEEERCFLAKARLRAKDADIVIANHAVVLSGIIPPRERNVIIDEEDATSLPPTHVLFPNEAKFLVIDEAHHLEDDATSAWTCNISKTDFDNLFEQLYGKHGVKRLIASIAKEKKSMRISQSADRFNNTEGDFRLAADSFFTKILPTLIEESSYKGGINYLSFKDLDNSSDNKKIFFDSLEDLEERLRSIAAMLDAFSNETETESVEKNLNIRSRTTEKIANIISKLRDDEPDDDDEPYVRYLERKGSIIEIKAAPLFVGKLLQDLVYNNFSSVIFTSATLTIDKTFNFFAERCGTSLLSQEEIDYKLLQSSFDYSKQVQFFITNGIVYDSSNEETRNNHIEQSAKFLEKAILASNGGALILCSSHNQVKQLYIKLHEPLARKNILLLRQEKGCSVNSIIRDFKEDINSVLIGTETLWQGVDIPGEALRTLFLLKTPYRMPRIPLIAARKEEIDRQGGNGFAEYYEPLAAMIMKQGFGRLIRKATDKGIVVFLDGKLARKPVLLNSFPEGVEPTAEDEEIILSIFEKDNNHTPGSN